MQYDPEKSHLSAELKAQFLQNCSSDSPTKAIPGVGSVTEERLAEKGIHTVGKLIDATDSFLELKALVGRVNAHKIYDAIEPMRRKQQASGSAVVPTASKQQTKEQTEALTKRLEDLGLVEEEQDRALEDKISSCLIS